MPRRAATSTCAVYDSSQQLLATGDTSGNERLDMTAVAGQTFYVQLVGINNNVTLRLTNLVSQNGETFT